MCMWARGKWPYICAWWGSRPPKDTCLFLTHLPPRIGPRQVANLYRVRSEVELSIRLDHVGATGWTRSTPSRHAP